MKDNEIYSLEQCKEDMLLIWGYLKDHPEERNKLRAIKALSGNDIDLYIRLISLDACCPCCYYSTIICNIERIEDPNECNYCPCWNTDG